MKKSISYKFLNCLLILFLLLGFLSVNPKSVQAALGRNMTAIRIKEFFPFDIFLIMLLKSNWMKSEIELKTDAGTILDSLNVRNIPLLRFICPPITVLKKFEQAVKPIWDKIDQNMQEIACLSDMRDSLLPKLMSGEIEV